MRYAARTPGERRGAGLAWAGIDAIGTAGLSFLSLLIVARALGPAELGLAALAVAIVQFFNVFVEGLFHDALVQRAELQETHLDTAFWTALAVGSVLALAAVPGGRLAAAAFGETRLAALVSVAALSLPCAALVGVGSARMRRALRFRALAWRSLVARTAGCCLVVAIALADGGAWSLVVQQVASSLILALLLLADWRPRLRFARRQLIELAGFALPQLLRQVLWTARLQGFTMLAGAFAGTAALGYLNLAFRSVNTLQTLLTTALQQFALPHFARRQADPSALIRAYDRAAAAIALATFPAFAGLAIVAGDLIPLVLGERWRGAVPAVEILATAGIFNFAGFAAAMIVTATGRLGYAIITAAASMAVTLGGLMWLRPDDAMTAALLWAAPVALSPLLGGLWLHRLLRLSPAAQMRPLLAPALAAASMAVAVKFAAIEALAALPALVRLIDEVALAGVVYAAVIIAVDRGWRRAAAKFVARWAPRSAVSSQRPGEDS